MREVPMTVPREEFVFGEALLAGECEILILLTGVGTRRLIAALSARWSKGEVVAALGRLQLGCRGPKPIAALKEGGLAPKVAAPEPQYWHDVLSGMGLTLSLAGLLGALQE